jgi:glucose-6-phosphate 1-dehydrogenase
MHPVEQLAENYLVICIEPTEGITLRFNIKIPGPVIRIDGVQMKFLYKDHFKTEPATDGFREYRNRQSNST